MCSHEQLINAVRAAGSDGKTFSVKDVRVQLGFDSRDKKELSRFRRRLRAFEKDVGEQLQKVGTNSYRLKVGAFETAALETAALETSAAPKRELAEPASGVFETIAAPEAAEAVQPELVAAQVVQLEAASEQPVANDAPSPSIAARVAEHTATNGAPKAVAAFSVQQASTNGAAAHISPAHVSQPSAAVSAPQSSPRHSLNPLRRATQLATTIVSGALAATAAVSGRARERSHNLRELLWSCIQAVPNKQQAQPAEHVIARLRVWAEGLRPLSGQVRTQLNALRQRVRRA